MGSAQSEAKARPEYPGSQCQIISELKERHSSDKESKILSEIVQAVESVKQNQDEMEVERLVQLYFELGCEVNRSKRRIRVSSDNDRIILATAYAISDIAFSIDSFLQGFSSRYLRYGHEGSAAAKYTCILLSGLKFMFELYEPDMVLKYEDGVVTIGEIIQSIKEEGNYDGLLEDFEYWFKTECYLENNVEIMNDNVAEGHWWWT
jgi:hypothetical protein